MLTLILALQAAEPTIDTITVTGRVPVVESPATVDVLDTSDLRVAQAITSLDEALQLVPGLTVVPTGPLGTQASIFIRGTDSDHVLTTLDGIRLNSPATPNGAYNFGSDLLPEGLRVEVLRGPASATYGSDAIGGVVSLVPVQRPGGAVSASVGELETLDAAANFGGEAGALAYSLGGAFRSTGGWDAVPGRIVAGEREGERDGAEGYSVNGRLAYALTPSLTATLTGLRREAEAEFDTFSGGPSFAQRADARDLESTDELSVLRAGLTYTSKAWSVTANLGGVDGDFRETNGGAVTGEVHGRRRFGELLGRYEADRLTVSAGAIYEEERADIPVSFNDPLDVEEDHEGAFVFAQGEASEALTLQAALRVDDYEGFDTPVTWNAGAIYAVGPVRLRAAAGTAYNVPTLSERFSTSLFAAANPDLQPEEAFAAEVGAAYDVALAPGTLTAEAVLFRTDTDELIEYQFATLQNVNAGDARAQGAELSLRWTGQALTAFAAYTYTDAENRDTGTPLLRRPEHGFNARANWQATKRLALSGRWVRTGERPDVLYDAAGFFLGSGDADGFDEVAATARYELAQGLTGFVTVANLLGETYEQPAGFGSAPRRVRAGLRFGW